MDSMDYRQQRCLARIRLGNRRCGANRLFWGVLFQVLLIFHVSESKWVSQLIAAVPRKVQQPIFAAEVSSVRNSIHMKPKMLCPTQTPFSSLIPHGSFFFGRLETSSIRLLLPVASSHSLNWVVSKKLAKSSSPTDSELAFVVVK